MARPLRYEAAGAVYHLMARGDGGMPVFEDDMDRYGWLDLLGKPVSGLAGGCMRGFSWATVLPLEMTAAEGWVRREVVVSSPT